MAAFSPCSALLPPLASFNHSRTLLAALMMESRSAPARFVVERTEQTRGAAGKGSGQRERRAGQPAAARAGKRGFCFCRQLQEAGHAWGKPLHLSVFLSEKQGVF